MKGLVNDVIIVGGGPAGSLLALLLGRAGMEVELYEQSRFPREKPCGEGLLPFGVEVLERAGAMERVGGRRLAGVRYHLAGGTVRSSFGQDSEGRARSGFGLRRHVMDQELWRLASGAASVSSHEGVAVTAPVLERGLVTGIHVHGEVRRAHLVVAADGASSVLRRKLGLEKVLAPPRVGVRAHFRLAHGQPDVDDIQIFLRRGYEIYVTPLPDGEVLVALLAHQDALGKNLREAFFRLCRTEPQLGRLLEGATQISELMGRAPLLKRSSGRIPDGLILIGDAATSTDPISAGGMSLALSSAESLALHMRGILDGKGSSRRAFERTQKRLLRVHRWLGAGLRALGSSSHAAEGARRLIEAHPQAMQSLVEVAGGGGA